MSKIADYEWRAGLLGACAAADADIKWGSLIQTAEKRAEHEAQEMILGRPRPARPGEQDGDSLPLVIEATVPLASCATLTWIMFTGLVLHATSLGIAALVALWSAPAIVGGVFVGVMADLGWRQRRQRRQLTSLKLLVPESVTYSVAGIMHTEGEIMAEITRTHPTVEDGVVIMKSESMGSIVLGADESAEITDRFQHLDSELQELAATSAYARETALQKANLSGEDLIGREVALRERVTTGRERREINATLPKALTAASTAA